MSNLPAEPQQQPLQANGDSNKTPAVASAPIASPAVLATITPAALSTSSAGTITAISSSAASAATSVTSASAPSSPTTTSSIPLTPGTLQLKDLPLPRLAALAEELGVDVTQHKTHASLVAATFDRRSLIASLDREALVDILKWARRPIVLNASREQLAVEIVEIKSMRFAGLSQRGLVALARLRGANRITETTPVDDVIYRLKKQEGFFAKIGRKRRALVGSVVAKLIGDAGPTDAQTSNSARPAGDAARDASFPHAQDDSRALRHEIEEQGLVAGLTSRVKRSADAYINQKLDEIEQRIDRKLDEIDRRLAEWRDKEIANRIRILKITLWVSVIVAGVSLLYSYVHVYFWNYFR